MFGSLRKKKRSGSNASTSSTASLSKHEPSITQASAQSRPDKVKDQVAKRASLFAFPSSPSSSIGRAGSSKAKTAAEHSHSPLPKTFSRSPATSLTEVQHPETFPTALSLQDATLNAPQRSTSTSSSSSPLSASASLASAQHRDQESRYPKSTLPSSSPGSGSSKVQLRDRKSSLPSLMKSSSAAQASSLTISPAAAVGEPSSRHGLTQSDLDQHASSSPKGHVSTVTDENDARTLLSHINSAGLSNGHISPSHGKSADRAVYRRALSSNSSINTPGVTSSSDELLAHSSATKTVSTTNHQITSTSEQSKTPSSTTTDDTRISTGGSRGAVRAEELVPGVLAKRKDDDVHESIASSDRAEMTQVSQRASGTFDHPAVAKGQDNVNDLTSSMATFDALSVPMYNYEVRRHVRQRGGGKAIVPATSSTTASLDKKRSVQARLTIGLHFERVARLSFIRALRRGRSASSKPMEASKGQQERKPPEKEEEVDGTMSFVYAIVDRHRARPAPALPSLSSLTTSKPEDGGDKHEELNGRNASRAIDVVRLAIPELLGARRLAYWAIERSASLVSPLVNLLGS